MESIELKGRYGYVHHLDHIKDNLWVLQIDPKAGGYFRLIGFKGEDKIGDNVSAIDPDGGPFLQVGDTINGKTIKSITRSGFLELE